jgi:hypothetical protein
VSTHTAQCPLVIAHSQATWAYVRGALKNQVQHFSEKMLHGENRAKKYLQLFSPMIQLSMLLVANLAPTSYQPTGRYGVPPVVVQIQEAEFQHRYLERRPLDRCTFAQDLSRILDMNPRRLVIDFDLSPSEESTPMYIGDMEVESITSCCFQGNVFCVATKRLKYRSQCDGDF